MARHKLPTFDQMLTALGVPENARPEVQAFGHLMTAAATEQLVLNAGALLDLMEREEYDQARTHGVALMAWLDNLDPDVLKSAAMQLAYAFVVRSK